MASAEAEAGWPAAAGEATAAEWPGGLGWDQEEEDGQIYDHAVIRRLFKYLIPHWRKLLLTLAAILVYTGTVITIPFLVSRIINYLLSGDPSKLECRRPELLQHGPLRSKHLRTEPGNSDLRGCGAAPVRQSVPQPEDDGLHRPESPVQPPGGPLPPPPEALNELLQQERGWPGDVQGPERRAAAPGVPVHRHDHLCGRPQPRRDRRRDGGHERAARGDYPAAHPVALRDGSGMAEVRPPRLHEGPARHLRRQRRAAGEHFRRPRRAEHEPRGARTSGRSAQPTPKTLARTSRPAGCRPSYSPRSSSFPPSASLS